MQDKYIYSILLLVLVVILSQIFAIIMMIPMIREGLESECLPNCKDISLNMSDGKTVVIPKCKKLVAKQLTAEDALKSGEPIVTRFTNEITNHLNQEYQFNKLFSPLYNTTIKISYGNTEIENIPQININKYFTDFSGISVHTNQDILDNMAEDSGFKSTLNAFKYTTNNQNPTTQVKKQIIELLDKYKEDRSKGKPKFFSMYDTFIKDMTKLYEAIQSRCKNYYSDEVLKSIAEDTTVYYGKSSSFHRLSNYIVDAISGKLGQV